MRNSKPVLLIDDDTVDAMALERAFKDLKITNRLVRATNSEEALKYLRSEGNEKPCIIFLDSSMPKMNGIEFLRIIKTDEEMKRIPVVVLTTTKEEQHIAESFELGVAGYMVKVADYEKFVKTIGTIDLYWSLSELPDCS